MTYREVNDRVLEVFGSQPIINSVTSNSLEWNEYKNTQYPSVACDLQNVTVDSEGNSTYNYMITAAKLGVESELDRISNYSQLMQVLYDGIEELRDDFDIDDTVTYQFASLKYMDVLDVATCSVSMVCPMDSDCEEDE